VTRRQSSQRAAGWSHFAHEADIGVRGWGPTAEVAFEQAALALTAVITEQPVALRERVTVRCQAPALDLLLVEWLNALVYEMAVRRMLFGRFRVRITDDTLEGEAFGETVDVARHRPAVEVKGATYTALRVAKERDGLWRAECVADV
jgi:protein archease